MSMFVFELLCSASAAFWLTEFLRKVPHRDCVAYSGAALIKFFCPKCGAYSRAALIRGRQLFK